MSENNLIKKIINGIPIYTSLQEALAKESPDDRHSRYGMIPWDGVAQYHVKNINLPSDNEKLEKALSQAYDEALNTVANSGTISKIKELTGNAFMVAHNLETAISLSSFTTINRANHQFTTSLDPRTIKHGYYDGIYGAIYVPATVVPCKPRQDKI